MGGVKAEAALPWTNLPLVARAFLGYRHAFGDVDPRAVLAFQGGGPNFTVAGAPIDREVVVAQAGLDNHAAPNLTIGLTGSGQAGARASDGAIKGSIKYRF